MGEDNLEIIDIVAIEDEEDVEIIETIQVIEVEDISHQTIDVGDAFAALGEPNEQLNHALLNNRDIPDQHPITAITGLREELDEIEELKTVYSDKIGIANYYEWNEGAYDEAGYFVSLVPQTSTIKICDGSNIFGVTVDATTSAGFIGGQDADNPRNNRYGLVMTSGLVDVRCELDVEAGDYVVSNIYGVAEKTTSGCGYQVVAKENKHGVDYAVISLGVQACTTDLLGKDLQLLSDRVDDAEINIAAAMNTANAAYNKANDSITSNNEMSNQIADALDKVDDMASDVESMEEQVGNLAAISAQAKAIAETAATSAEGARLEAVAKADEALDRAAEIEKTVEPISTWEYTDPVTGETNTGATYFAEYVKHGLSTKAELETVSRLDEENKLLIEKNAESINQMVSSIDKYCVGEYSQAYGLTLEQARNILKDGMIYIPTRHGNTNTHIEKYLDADGNELHREFTCGYYYIWTVLDNGEEMWSEHIGEVWFGSAAPAGTGYDYWYDGDVLYILHDGQWIEVATLAGNVNSRLTSMIRQEVGEIAFEVSNTRGSVATLTEQITDTNAVVQSLALWSKGGDENGEQYNLATIQQKAEDASADIALVVQEKDGEKVVNGASIAAAINSQTGDSFVSIEAKYVNLKGQVTFESFDEDTKNKIEAGSIDVQIWSSRGNIFKSRDVTTILTCHVFSAGVDITNTLDGNAFRWEKINDDGTKDEEWQATPYGNSANAIQITAAEVWSRAMFNCEVTI
jgi:hypothetical protein